jgi:uncharacterized protein YbaP (TraB family)
MAFDCRHPNGQALTLLGALHSGMPGFYPLPPPLQQRWWYAGSLWVEIDAKQRHAELVGAFTPVVNLPDGQTIEQLVHPEQIRQARELFRWDEQRWQQLRLRQPWWVVQFAFQVGLPDPRWQSRSEHGLEPTLLAQARARQLPVIELEQASAQVRALSDLPLANQAILWQRHLEDISQFGPLWPRLAKAWIAGDGPALTLLKQRWWGSPTDAALGELYASAFSRRDTDMARTMHHLMGAGDEVSRSNPFVLVGAFHLVGPNNLPDNLGALGWRLKAIAAPDLQYGP